MGVGVYTRCAWRYVTTIPQGESASVYVQLFEPPCDRAAGVLRDGVAPPAAEVAVQRVEWACRSANPQISCPPGLPQPTASPPISPEASSRLLLLLRGSRAVLQDRSESNGKAFILRDFQFVFPRDDSVGGIEVVERRGTHPREHRRSGGCKFYYSLLCASPPVCQGSNFLRSAYIGVGI